MSRSWPDREPHDLRMPGIGASFAATDSARTTASSAASPNAASWAGSGRRQQRMVRLRPLCGLRHAARGTSVLASWARLGSHQLTATSRRAASSLAATPANYVSQGTGQDTRVLITLRDPSSTWTAPARWSISTAPDRPQRQRRRRPVELPSSSTCATKQRRAIMNCSPQSLQNTNNLLATGAGYVKHEGGQLMFPSSLTVPARLSDNPICNRLFDPAFNGQYPRPGTIRRDTAGNHQPLDWRQRLAGPRQQHYPRHHHQLRAHHERHRRWYSNSHR